MAERKFIIDSGWQLLLKDLGLSAQDVFLKAGLPPDFLNHQRLSLDVGQYYAFWDAMLAITHDPLFPMKAVQAIKAEMFSPPLFASLCSPNLDVALTRIQQYKPLIGPMTLTIMREGEETLVVLNPIENEALLPATLVAMEFCFFVHLARLATREDIAPVRMQATFPLPEQSEYERYFGDSIGKGDVNGLAFSRKDADLPFLTANDALWSMFEPELKTRMRDLQQGAAFRDRVRACLNETIASGTVSKEEIAKKLAVSPRTLQRRLKDENTSFQHELSTVRENLARHYLTKSAYSSAEISFLLGYDDTTSFYRAFQNWTGSTPDSVRQSSGVTAH